MTRGGEFLLPSNTLPDIFTVNQFTDEQMMIRETIREVVAKTIITDDAIRAIESKDWAFSRGLLRSLAELGVLGMEVPEEYGGTNLDKVCSTIVAEEMGKQGSFACTLLAHTGIGTLPIRFFGTEEQKVKYLPKLISGEWVAAYSLTEIQAGSDANAVKTKAALSQDGKHYILNGAKRFVTNGGFADLYIVFAKIEGDDKITAFIVERSFSGVVVGKEEHKMGTRGSSTVDLMLQDVLVPVENLLGERGRGFKEIALNILNLGRFKLAAASLGGAKHALRQSVDYSRERKQFGQPISSFGAIRYKLAMMAAKIYAMQSVVYRTAGHLEDSIGGVDQNDSRAILKAIEEFAPECSIVKVFCSEALGYVVDENVQIHGGVGFCEGHPERAYRDSRINRIFEGTNEINRMLVFGMILKKAMAGALPLMAVGEKLPEEVMGVMVTEPEDGLDRLKHYLDNSKKATILASGAAWRKFGPKLPDHQIVVMALADCMINIYVMESALAALDKNRNEHDENLVRLLFDEKVFETENLVRRLVAMCSEGDTQRTLNSMVKRLLKFTPVNTEELVEKIVKNLVGA